MNCDLTCPECGAEDRKELFSCVNRHVRCWSCQGEADCEEDEFPRCPDCGGEVHETNFQFEAFVPVDGKAEADAVALFLAASVEKSGCHAKGLSYEQRDGQTVSVSVGAGDLRTAEDMQLAGMAFLEGLRAGLELTRTAVTTDNLN